MLQTYPHLADVQSAPSVQGVAWIDLLNPTDTEIAFVQSGTGLRVPNRAALSEIESTSRNYLENGAIYLSAPLIARAGDNEAVLSPVGFVLSHNILVTVRFADMKAFDAVAEAAAHMAHLTADEALVRLLEGVVDKGADLLEQAGSELDALSYAAFHAQGAKSTKLDESTRKLRETLRAVGRMGDRTSQIRDSLLGLGRITAYVAETGCSAWEPDLRQRLNAVRADVASLNDYEAHLANKVQFLLDATLGFINIEQNDIVKVLTIASIVGIPPVLIAGVYGMNFKIIPELSWTYGYPYSIVLMVISALLPLAWFKWRGWM